jgi:phosphoglycolate phosphatase-like HAD superfamily hydrolase
MFTGYIFDVEGTLVDSLLQNLRSQQEALPRSGFDLPYEALQLYSGLDGNQTLQIIAPDLDEEEHKQILQDQARIYETRYLHSVKALCGVREVRSAHRTGYSLALRPTARTRTQALLSLLHIDEFIAATAYGDDVEHGKPDPPIIGVALRKLGLTGREAVMIGDTPYDAEAASGAGAAAAGVRSGR